MTNDAKDEPIVCIGCGNIVDDDYECRTSTCPVVVSRERMEAMRKGVATLLEAGFTVDPPFVQKFVRVRSTGMFGFGTYDTRHGAPLSAFGIEKARRELVQLKRYWRRKMARAGTRGRRGALSDAQGAKWVEVARAEVASWARGAAG